MPNLFPLNISFFVNKDYGEGLIAEELKVIWLISIMYAQKNLVKSNSTCYSINVSLRLGLITTYIWRNNYVIWCDIMM